jgi:deazaflavin-dependent oxidoreductase (nitroreductase family)
LKTRKLGTLEVPEGNQALKERLRQASEIDLTAIGRKSGRSLTQPVWFVVNDDAINAEEDTIYLLPVRGSDTQWYKNVLKNPSIRIAAQGAEAEAQAVPLTERGQVSSVVEKFRNKYGDRDVKRYYSRFDVAVVVRID